MRALFALRDRPSEPVCLVSIAHLAMQLASQATPTSSFRPSGITLSSIRRNSPLSPNPFPTISPVIMPSHLLYSLRGSLPQRMQVASP